LTGDDTVKFLLVDDVPENLLALEGLLRRDGLEFKTARSGPEALELLLKHDFALALLDVQLPDMDGFELAELMRGTDRTRRVPIIFLTAVATDERRRFRGYESGAVDYLIKPLDPHILRRKADVFFELDRQRRELMHQRDRLRDSEERFRSSVLQAPAPMMLFAGHGGVLVVNDELLDSTGFIESEIRTLRAWVHKAHGERAAEALAHFESVIAEKADRSRAEFDVTTSSGQTRTWDFVTSSVGHALDGHDLFIFIAHDITERKQAERTQQLLIGELNHRVKNTLATVQAIAQQTLRRTNDPAGFAASFSGRLQSLSRAHSILSDATWKGADVRDLIRDQLSHGAVDQGRLIVSGPPARLAPQTALHLALMLHELGTNATKYGALSGTSGEVRVSWSIEQDKLRLQWRELGGPEVVVPEKTGFGSMLIEQTAKSDGGSARVEYAASGIEWDIHLPLADIEELSGAKLIQSSVAPSSGLAPVLGGGLQGKRLLVVEDEPLIALDMASRLEEAGAAVLGPAGTADEAIGMVETEALDGALLDGNLHGRSVETIAAALRARGVPFTFVTGYGRSSLPGDFAEQSILAKPFTSAQLLAAAEALLQAPARMTRDHSA